MRNVHRIAVVILGLAACGRTPIDTELGVDETRDRPGTTAISQVCTEVCEQLACDPQLELVVDEDSFSACTRACEQDRRAAASASARCSRAHDDYAECIVLADCDELEMLEQGGIATCRVQTDDLARHCADVDFELAG